MRVKSRLSPYPILDNYGDDYVNSSFDAEYEMTTQFSEIYAKIRFHLENKEIEELIKNEKAQYLVHVECPSTCFRMKFSSTENEIEFKLSSVNLAKILEIRTFIVLTQDIKNFKSVDFHPDYLGETFNLFKHQIIAIGTGKNYILNKDDRDLESLPSVIQIMKTSDKKGSLTVNTDSDNYIMVGLSEDVYELYARLGKNTYKSTAFSLILLPALMIVLQRMHANKDDEDYKSRHWFQVINSILENNKQKLDDITIENDTLLMVCQSIFADPISRSFKELDSCSERM